MAVKNCCIENCKSCSTRKEDKGVTFHKFPKDATSCNEWQSITHTHYKHIHKDSAVYVCSRHFCMRDFKKNKDAKYILKSDAVPSIFTWTMDNINMDTSKNEESLSSITDDDDKTLSFSSKGSESENLEAIKKFIEEQEKEILEKETEEKELQEKNLKIAEKLKKPSENVETNKDMDVALSVMDMILSESEAKIAKTDAEEDANDVPKPALSTIESSNQKMVTPMDKGNATMSLSIGSKVEVSDFGGDWHAAEIAEMDYDEMEVLVRYDIELKKTDEWISVSSSRLRPYTGTTKKPAQEAKDPNDRPMEKAPLSKEKNTSKDTASISKDKAATSKDKASTSKDKAPILKEKPPPKDNAPPKEIKEEPKEDIIKVEEKQKLVFEVGERCLARWRDNRRFMATIHQDLGDGNFEIVFDDGFHWKCNINRMHKMKTDLTVDTTFQSAIAGSPSPLDLGSGASTSGAPISPAIPAFHTHLFDPTRDYLGSKSERREKKRKLNIKEIFNIGQKRTKLQKVEKPKTPVEKKPKPVKKNVAPKVPRVVLNKEIKREQVPDAVASIIGTVTKEVEIKLEQLPETSEYIRKGTPKITSEESDELDKSADEDSIIEDSKEEIDEMQMVDMIPIDCIVNPNDKTLDDEDTEEPKSESDPVLEEEVKLENFEKQDTEKHEQEIDMIKEAIIKLEFGIKERQENPKLEIAEIPNPELELSKDIIDELEIKQEVTSENLKDVLAEVAASIDVVDIKKEDKKSCQIEIKKEKPKMRKIKINPLRMKRDHSKIKKGKKLRLLQDNRVNRQVAKVKSELEQMKRQFEAMRRQILVQTEEYEQCKDNAPLPESCLNPGEWCCRWVNGQPVGKVSEIEGAVQLGADNKPALPRRSVQVDDKRLPPGWIKHMVRRSVGHSAGKWDVVLVSPEEHGNKRFHTRTDMHNFLEQNPDDSLKQYEHALYDFGVHLKISRRMGWIVNTPDGIAEAPETILPAGTTSTLSPLVKKRKLKLQERGLIVKEKKRGHAMKEKKRRPIKLKLQKGLHTYKSQIIGGDSSSEIKMEPTENIFEPPLMRLEDGYEYVGSLKVQIIENLLRCPAEGCFKNFRTKTLLQMHIKHYHRELKAMMGATPKVLDLAYARTMPNEADVPQIDKKIIKVKINKPPKREEPKIPLIESPESPTDIFPTTPTKSEDSHSAPVIPRIPRSLDSPKLRQALIHKPVKRPRVLLPVRRLEPEQATPESLNDDVFENQTIEPVIEIPILEHPLDFETAISTHTVTKPLEKKKKGDKKKSFAAFSKNISEDEEWFAMNSDDLDTRSSFPLSGSPDSKTMDIKMAPMSSESNDDQKDTNLYTYTETGERIKIVHMKREEIINCHCGFREEDGLMVQCELCLCWQHALCHNIQRECEVPEKYTCSICLNPRRGRRSKRFLHDQDRLYEGLLPGAKPCESLRRSHELAGNLLRIDDALHAMRVKCYVACKKDHPKLYLWAKDWEQAEISYSQVRLNSDYSDLNVMINGMDKENHPVRVEDDGMDIRTPPSEEQDNMLSRDQLGSHALLSGLLSSPGAASLDLPIPLTTTEFERLARSMQDSHDWQRVTAPQPEPAIENDACRKHLLRHIKRCHALIDSRLDSIEAQVAELESQDPSFGENYESAEYYPRAKQTVRMLMRDLDTMEELGVIT